MDERQVLELLGDVSAVITGSHIVYTSFKHGSKKAAGAAGA